MTSQSAAAAVSLLVSAINDVDVTSQSAAAAVSLLVGGRSSKQQEAKIIAKKSVMTSVPVCLQLKVNGPKL